MPKLIQTTADPVGHPGTPCDLYVREDIMTPIIGSGPSAHFWYRLVWWDGKSDHYVGAEGECSKRNFETLTAAAAYGEQTYGERPKHWGRDRKGREFIRDIPKR